MSLTPYIQLQLKLDLCCKLAAGLPLAAGDKGRAVREAKQDLRKKIP
jgi:hypothetical protein